MLDKLCNSMLNDLLAYRAKIASLYASYHLAAVATYTDEQLAVQCALYRLLDSLITTYPTVFEENEILRWLKPCYAAFEQMRDQPDSLLSHWGIEDFHVQHVILQSINGMQSQSQHSAAKSAEVVINGKEKMSFCTGDKIYHTLFGRYRDQPQEKIEQVKQQLLQAILESMETRITDFAYLLAHERDADFTRDMPYDIHFDQAMLDQYTVDLLVGGDWHSCGMLPEGTQKTLVRNRYAMTKKLNDCYFKPDYQDEHGRAVKDLTRGNFLKSLVNTFQIDREKLAPLLRCYIHDKDILYTLMSVSGQMATSSLSPAHQLISLIDDKPDCHLRLVSPTQWTQDISLHYQDGQEQVHIENHLHYHILMRDDFSSAYVLDANSHQWREIEFSEVEDFKSRSYLNHITLDEAELREENKLIDELIRLTNKQVRTPDSANTMRIEEIKSLLAQQAMAITRRQQKNETQILNALQKQYRCIPAVELITRLKIHSTAEGVNICAQEVTVCCRSPQMVYDYPKKTVSRLLSSKPWLPSCTAPMAHVVKQLVQNHGQNVPVLSAAIMKPSYR